LSKSAFLRWSLTRDRAFLHELPAHSEVSAAVRAFSEAVRDGRPEASEFGARLYEMLLGSLPPVCQSKPVWKLALDRELFEAPFAALRSGGRYLNESHQLEILPSTLASFPAHGFSQRFAGFGDPVYNRADERFPARGANLLKASQPELSRLPGSKSEVESCARAWGAAGLPQSVSLGALVTHDRISEALAGSPAVLHLATHVIPSPGEPGSLALAFGLTQGGQMELMSTRETCRYRANVGLVTLSGCASGSGPVRDGAGLMGLTRSWLLAGARSVVASYWPVPDEDGRLFRSFYAELASEWARQGRFCPAGALQKSQLTMLRSRGFHGEPRHWAAYFTVSRGLPE
jgi:CHAT domain-containing protein